MNWTVKVSRGDVVGVGKIKVPRTMTFNYEIPMLTFLVIGEPDGGFVSTCLNLHIDGYGKQDKAAVDDMLENIDYFLNANFSKLPIDDAWLNLRDLGHFEPGELELWNAYRDIQFSLASKGISMDSVPALKERIALLQQEMTNATLKDDIMKALKQIISSLQHRIKQLEAENLELKKTNVVLMYYTPLRNMKLKRRGDV